MEVLVVVSTALAIVLLGVWARERFRPSQDGATDGETPGDEPLLRVVVDLPGDEQAGFVAGVLQRLEDGRTTGSSGSVTVVPAPHGDPGDQAHVVLRTDHGPAVLDAILGQLRSEGYRVERTVGHEIGLCRQGITRARVTVTRDGQPD